MKIRAVFLFLIITFLAAPSWSRVSLKPGPQLWVYSTKGDINSVKELVESNALDRDVLGRALYHTLRRGKSADVAADMEILKLLLSYGADINYRSMTGQTPLVAAINANYIEAARLLLENGADPEIVDLRNKKAYDYAAKDDDMRMLLKNPPPLNPVEKASADKPSKLVNLDLAMEGNEVFMTFDIVGTKKACVRVKGSFDKGENYNMTFRGATGDIGANIAPGRNKRIVWRTLVDYPDGIGDMDVLIDVETEECK